MFMLQLLLFLVNKDVYKYYLDLDLVPPVLIRTLGDELSPSGTVVGSISCVIRINTQCVQIFLQCVLPCPLWSSDPPPATYWSPHYGQTSWSGCRESQDVPNKSSSSGGYCVMQCSLSSSCRHFVICDVVAPWNAQNTPKASTVEKVNHLVDFVGCFPCFAGIDPGWDYNGRVQT